MTTTRIEEVVNESIIGFSLKVKGLDGDILDELTDDIRKALTEAHQAGIDEAVEVLKEKRNGHCGKKGCLQAYCINRKIIREFCDDTIKALQDKK